LERELAAVEKMKKGFEALAETAKAESKAELKEVFEEISRGGAETRRLGEICETITDGDHQPPPKSSQGVPFLVISNLASGRISFENTRFVPKAYYGAIQENRKPRKGDVLLTVTGSYGIPVVVETKEIFCFQRHIALLKLLVDWDYLYFALISPVIKAQCDAVATGTAQKTVGLKSLRSMLVPLPPLAEQKRIVAKLEEILPLCDRLK
jgi:type I restriction enzyme S subunit